MVTITEIRRLRSSDCVMTDTGEQFWLTHCDLQKSSFKEGASYDEEAFLQQVRILQYPHALNLAVSMLARRPYSRGEILSRLLIRHYTEDVSNLVICKLEKENLLDDEAFCEQWVRFRAGHGIGRTRIYYELKMKGVSEGIILTALNELDEDTEKESAVRQAVKAWNRVSTRQDICTIRQKVITHLVRKGYSWETAKSACDMAEMQKE